MFKLLRILISNKNFLFFIFLEIVSFVLIIKSHDYAQTKTHDWQTAVAGFFDRQIYAINSHFYLKKYNDSLLKQNAQLIQALLQKKYNDKTPVLPGQFKVKPAYVLTNQYTFDHNTLIINKGRKDSIIPEMGVVTNNGVVGVIQKTSGHFSRVISVLNKSSKINVALKNTNYSGFLAWTGEDPNYFEVIDMPVNANLKRGDTLVTGGMSNYFPRGLLVGKIIDFKTVPGRKSYVIQMKTFADMTNLGPVYVLKNNYKAELDSLKLKQ